MPRITDQLWDKLSWAYFALFFIAAGFHLAFQQRLKRFHPDAWEASGSPSVLNISLSKSLQSVSFLLRKKYEPLGDERLNFYGAGARIGLIAIIGFLALFIVAALVGQYQNGVWDQPQAVQYKPLTGAGTALLVCITSYLVSWSFFLTRLKQHHRQVWEGLGEPSFLNQTFSNAWKTQKFFFGGEYLRLNDAALNIWAAAVWVLGLGSLWFFWASR